MQKKDELGSFLQEIMQKKTDLLQRTNKNIPIFLKIAPDLDHKELKDIADIVLQNKVDAVIISNSTISRNNLKSNNQKEQGGLTGKPLLEISNNILSKFYKFTGGKVPLIASGGVFSAQDAYQKIKLGASMIQIYSAFIYKGFSLVEKIKKELDLLIKKDGFENINDAVGIDHKK